MSQQSEMADRVYDQLAHSDLSAAELVHELRAKWGPEHRAAEVHRFVAEVAACLLREDVAVGDLRDGRFSAWTLDPWDAHKKIADDLMSLDSFLENKTQYVFHRT
jgi:hypothetical protein